MHGRKMEPWKVHLRRAPRATHGREQLKISGDVVSLLLSHTPRGPKVTRNDQRAELLDERREALASWADWLEQLRTGKTQLAKVAGVCRETLYRSLSADGSPGLQTVFRVLDFLGIRFAVRAA